MELSLHINLTLDFAEAYYISITAQNMATLADLSEHSAEIEIALHLAIISDGERLLEWFDLPDDPISIAQLIKEETVSHFAESVGAKFERITLCDNRSFIDV